MHIEKNSLIYINKTYIEYINKIRRIGRAYLAFRYYVENCIISMLLKELIINE